jgi:hypothetical protein
VSVKADFWSFLRSLQELTLTPELGLWQAALIVCPDLQAACGRGDLAAARTAVAGVTLRHFSEGTLIPPELRECLEILGVAVRW